MSHRPIAKTSGDLFFGPPLILGDLEGARSSQSGASSALERGADVLLLFANSAEPNLGVTQIANHLGLSKAVVHRILSALRNKGLVELDATSHRYCLGPVIMSLGLTYLQKLEVRAVAMPELIKLSHETNETTILSVRTGPNRVYVDQVTPKREVLMLVQIGVSYPLHAGASSKAIPAFLPSDEIDRYLAEPLAKITVATITDRRRLRRELAQIAERGWATSVGERQIGAGSVSRFRSTFPSNKVPRILSVCAESNIPPFIPRTKPTPPDRSQTTG